MKILVCVSCVPDTTSKISFIDNKEFDKDGVQYIIGPYEDYALSRAVELKEKDNRFFYSKYQVVKLLDIMTNIKDKVVASQIVEDLYLYAASRSKYSSKYYKLE